MFLILLGTGAGLLCGIISGIIPGIHSNTVAGIMLGVSPVLLTVLGPAGLAAALVSMLITHTFLEIIPSTFLGIPDAGTALSVLPAHAMTLEGKGEEAVRLSALGSGWGMIIAIPLSILLILVLTPAQGYIDWVIGSVLIFMMGMVIIHNGSPGWNLLIFCVSGILGLFAFRYDFLAGTGSILMPLLTGLFGLPVILTAAQGPVPAQRFSGIRMETGEIARAAIPGSAAGVLVGWLPGLSTASATAVVHVCFRYDTDRERYLVAAGAAAMVNAVISLAAFYAIERKRNGVMVALASLEYPSLPVLLAVSACSSLIAWWITIRLAGSATLLSGRDSRTMNTVVAGFLIVLCAVSTGPFGLLILACATGIGLVPSLLDLSRVSCMGVVTLPVIVSSLGLGGF